MSAKKKSNKRRRTPAGPSRPPTAKQAAARPPGSKKQPVDPAAATTTSVPTGSRPTAAAPAPAKAPRERSGPTKAERLAAAEAARRRRRLRNRALMAAALAAVIVAVTLVVVNNRREEAELARQLESGGCQLDGASDSDAGGAQGRNHVASPAYEVNPPAGGNHLAQVAPAGRYTATNAPADGQVVHSMEHGYVIFWHAPDLPVDQVERLRDLANKYDRDVLLVPRAGMPVPVAATAWHRRLLCGGAPDLAAMERFVVEFRNEGPEKVPR